jgi:hypothetical protein
MWIGRAESIYPRILLDLGLTVGDRDGSLCAGQSPMKTRACRDVVDWRFSMSLISRLGQGSNFDGVSHPRFGIASASLGLETEHVPV